jgi:hypothetical protein
LIFTLSEVEGEHPVKLRLLLLLPGRQHARTKVVLPEHGLNATEVRPGVIADYKLLTTG